MKREITFWEASAACLALSLLSFLAGMLEGRTMRGSTPAEQTVSRDTIIITDTVFVPSPSDTVVKTISKVVMVPVHTAANDIGVDSVPVLLPFDQHFTRLGDVADVWYSGFQASIDSARIYNRYLTVIEKHHTQASPTPANIVAIEAGPRDASLLYIRRFGTIYAGLSAGCTYAGEATARGFLGFQF